MTMQEPRAINRSEIARLASFNWHRDGCPPGRHPDYLQEAARQCRALDALLGSATRRHPQAESPDEAARTAGE